MKVTYLQSATVIIEHNGTKVLCDPWLIDGAYYGSWFYWPPFKFNAEDYNDIDYIYISHVHPDHCDVKTLAQLRKDIPILILDFEEKFLLRSLQRLGFTDIREIPHGTEVYLNDDFKVDVLSADNNDPRVFSFCYQTSVPEGEKTRQIDSMAVFSGGSKVVVNSNDCPRGLAALTLDYIKKKYKEIDLLLVSYAGAGPFPQSYNIESQNMTHFSVAAAYSFLSQTFEYIIQLSPRFYIPYASGYILGGKMSWMNQYKGTLEMEELLTDLVPQIKKNNKSEMVLLNSGESFDVDLSQASKPYVQTDFIERNRYIKGVLSKKLLDYESDPMDRTDILDKLIAARKVLWNKQHDYHYFKDFSVYIDTGLGYFYRLNFMDQDIKKVDHLEEKESFILGQMDPRFMNWILERKANWNNGEIGSHIRLTDRYYNPDDKKRTYDAMPHFMMSYLQMPVEKPLKQMVPEFIGAS